jgi:membrane associated rhomboid family serine protease
LKLDSRLRDIMRAEGDLSDRETQARLKPPDREFANLEQVELDGLTKGGFDALADLPQRRLGLVPAHVTVVGLVMHMFMHAGLLHLLGNLFLLYLSAPFLEDVWGRPFFAAFYLAAGIVSGTFFAVRYSGLDLPLIGASGAISGVIGAFLVRHWRRKIPFFYCFGFAIRGTFSTPAWAILPLYLVREFVSARSADMLAPGTGGPGVAYWAHVSGFGFGAAVATAVTWLGVERHYLAAALEAQLAAVDNSGLDRAVAMRGQGRPEEAWALLFKEAGRTPSNVDAILTLWGWAKESDRAAEAGPLLAKLVREQAQRGEASEAYRHWSELQRLAPEIPVSLALEVRLTEALVVQEMHKEAQDVVQRAANRATVDAPAGTLMRLARLSEGGLRARVTAFALARSDLSPALRAELENLASRGR